MQILLFRDDLVALAEMLDPDDHLTTLMDLDRDYRQIEQAMKKLPVKKRERVEMYLFSGKTQAEQAHHFTTSQPNVKRDFLRAIKSLVRLMSPTVEDPNSPYAKKVKNHFDSQNRNI